MAAGDTQPNGLRPYVLREYALLADGERGALVGPRGEIVWMCAPQWHSDAVFSALMGGRGAYVVGPADPWAVWGGYYEGGTLIWRSRWMTTSGAVECREALCFPSDPHTATVLRQVRALDTVAQMSVLLDPAAGFGAQPMTELHCNDGVWQARAGALYVRWAGAGQARVADDGLRMDLTVDAGQSHDLVLEISDTPLTGDTIRPGEAWAETEAQWARVMPDLDATLAPRDARHAYAVLTGLTSHSGGMVAAATASLPERSEAGRNYDYRYSWIRDQCWTGQAIASDGAHPLVDDGVDFISARVLADGPSLRPAYTVDGADVPGETAVEHLPGYPGGGNTVGNNIEGQFQLDTFGEVLLLLAAAARHDRLDSHHWRAAEVAADAIRQWREEPDAGVWELDDARWAHSRLICAAGLRAISRDQAPAPQAAAWSSLADSLVAETTKDCLHPAGHWQRSPDDPGVDAALLLPALRGGVQASDPRSLATLDAVREDLSEDGYVYRFRHDPRPLRYAEGAFLVCGFITALATQQQNETVEARAWFERHRAACGPPGLYSEEYDVTQRQLRGNLPQAFVHALLLEASSRLVRPWTQRL